MNWYMIEYEAILFERVGDATIKVDGEVLKDLKTQDLQKIVQTHI